MTQPHIVLFIEENTGRWHASELTNALEAAGARVTQTNLTQCAFDTESKTGLIIPGFDNALPDGAFVRSISTGTLEQITFRLGILHALGASGVRVWNPASVIERCVDKSTATFLFERHGLPVPKTRTCENPVLAQEFHDIHAPTVSKPLFGSQGNGVIKFAQGDPLPNASSVEYVYHLQRYASAKSEPSRFADIRVLVSNKCPLAAMLREGTSWITNVHQGAMPKPVKITNEMAQLAVGACEAVKADYAGVDLIQGDDGHLLVLEINSNPAWQGLQTVSNVNIARELANDFLDAVKGTGTRTDRAVHPANAE